MPKPNQFHFVTWAYTKHSQRATKKNTLIYKGGQIWHTNSSFLFASPAHEVLSHKAALTNKDLWCFVRHAFWENGLSVRKLSARRFCRICVRKCNGFNLSPDPFKVNFSYLHERPAPQCQWLQKYPQITWFFFSLLLKTPDLTILNVLTMCRTWSFSVVT